MSLMLSDEELWSSVVVVPEKKEEISPPKKRSRLEIAREKLGRLKAAVSSSIGAAYDHMRLSNGQPMNDKRGGAQFMERQEQLEDKIFNTLDAIKAQEERVEKLKWQEYNKEHGLNKQGTGIRLTVDNIPRIREEIEKSERGESFMTKATIRKYRKKLVELEALQAEISSTQMTPEAQALVASGQVIQWQKNPKLFFIKGLRKVALELQSNGSFALPSNGMYHPDNENDKLAVEELIGGNKETLKEPMTQYIGASRLRDEAHSKDIVAVGESLGMELVKTGRNYVWRDHDSFVFDTKKNIFYWNSRGFGGDAIRLVELMKECNFKEAVSYLVEGVTPKREEVVEPKKEFHYFLHDDQTIDRVKDFLVQERKLSPETVDFFYQKGIIGQANYKNQDLQQFEKALIFKNIDLKGRVRGIAVQGIEKHNAGSKRPYTKRTLGDGYCGTQVVIGHPPLEAGSRSHEKPLKIFVFEAPIDMMSYYELFRDKLEDCVLLSMNGLRKGTISTTLSDILFPNAPEHLKATALDHLQLAYDKTDTIKIVLAVDNDEAGRKFVKEFGVDVIPVMKHLPKISEGAEKCDWNDALKAVKRQKTSKFQEQLKATQTKMGQQKVERMTHGKKV